MNHENVPQENLGRLADLNFRDRAERRWGVFRGSTILRCRNQEENQVKWGGAMNKSRRTAGKAHVLVCVAAFALLAVGMMAVLAPAALAAQNSCPSGGTPPPGSSVNGGLEVDGTCIVNGVTVNGGITVEATGHLQLTSSIVNGGIVVLPCGEIDVNATTNGSGTPTGTFATINGGIVINAGTVCPVGSLSDADIRGALIDGGLSVTGAFPLALPFICGNEIRGGVSLNNVSTPFGFFLGDPDAPVFGCPGNTIHGTVHVSNSTNLEVESNSVGGSVLLSGSILELNGNTINGSLRCTDGTVILPGEPGDTPGNTVHGANHC